MHRRSAPRSPSRRTGRLGRSASRGTATTYQDAGPSTDRVAGGVARALVSGGQDRVGGGRSAVTALPHGRSRRGRPARRRALTWPSGARPRSEGTVVGGRDRVRDVAGSPCTLLDGPGLLNAACRAVSAPAPAVHEQLVGRDAVDEDAEEGGRAQQDPGEGRRGHVRGHVCEEDRKDEHEGEREKEAPTARSWSQSRRPLWDAFSAVRVASGGAAAHRPGAGRQPAGPAAGVRR